MIGDTYLDVPGLKEEMKGWKFPLHFIDFETSAVALPFYDKMRPYEQIAFQFSHHRVDMNEDGHIRLPTLVSSSTLKRDISLTLILSELLKQS